MERVIIGGNMELTVYRQSFKERPDGTVVYKGEDTLPIAGDSVILVADGLGGASAIRHKSINTDMFDSEKLMDTLFRGVYSDYSDGTFVKYVTDSFAELFAVKDCYTESVYNIKKGGYFASRIVSAIVLHELIYEEAVSPARLFEEYNALDEQDRPAALKKLGAYFAARISESIRRIAKNANLIYESGISGLALLGTTLCLTLFRETEDHVEAIYLTAGDSRPYIWTESDGLCQLIRDEEAADGGMTNYICANDDAKFTVDCRYMQFKKPCVLFNATDGCFDSAGFLSQMAFEKLILDSAAASADISEMQGRLNEAFVTLGTHDDSSTIAMKFFGYGTFEDFRNAAQQRLAAIERDYCAQLPGLLDTDYAAAGEEASHGILAQLGEVKEAFQNIEAVKALCGRRMKDGSYPPLEERYSVIRESTDAIVREKNAASDQILDIISRNYVRFCAYQDKDGLFAKMTVSRIEGVAKDHQKQSDSYLGLLEQYRSAFEQAAAECRSVIDLICEVGVPSDISDYGRINPAMVAESYQFMMSSLDFISSVISGKQGTVRKLIQLKTDYYSRNRKLASENIGKVWALRNKIISGEITLENIRLQILGTGNGSCGSILQGDYEMIRDALEVIRAADGKLEANRNEWLSVFAECRAMYWEENYEAVIGAAVYDAACPIPAELRSRAMGILEAVNARMGEMKRNAEMQTELFAKYDRVYGQYMEGEAEC